MSTNSTLVYAALVVVVLVLGLLLGTFVTLKSVQLLKLPTDILIIISMSFIILAAITFAAWRLQTVADQEKTLQEIREGRYMK